MGIKGGEVCTMIQETSREAYHDLKNLGERQIQVFEVIEELEGACNTMIANKLKLPISSITPRTRELVKKGFVEEGHKGLCPYTHKTVIFWRIKNGI